MRNREDELSRVIKYSLFPKEIPKGRCLGKWERKSISPVFTPKRKLKT